MQIVSFADVLKAAEDVPILAFKGKIKSVYKPRASKPGAATTWKYQDLIVTDGAAELKVTLSDRDDFPQTEKGKWYYFLCVKSEKHGWVGVKTKDDSYEGKTTRILRVSKTAEVLSADEYGQKHEGSPPLNQGQPQAPAAAPAKPAATAAAPGPKPAPSEACSAAKKFLASRANLMVLCLEAKDYVCATYKARNGHEVTPEQQQAITSTLFIATDRKEFGAIADAIPFGPLDKYSPKHANQPAQAAPAAPAPQPEPEPEPPKKVCETCGYEMKGGKCENQDCPENDAVPI